VAPKRHNLGEIMSRRRKVARVGVLVAATELIGMLFLGAAEARP
jgi:hypothetical protein